MPNDLLTLALIAWLVAALVALTGRCLVAGRALLFLGSLAGIAAALLALPGGTSAVALPTMLADESVPFAMSPEALWLFGFGLAPAALAGALATPAVQGRAGWLFGAAMSLIGALGVFGLGNGAGFLIAWEIMSFGGAVMILSEKLAPQAGRPVLFMLGLLEIGAVALLVALLLLAVPAHSFAFAALRPAAAKLSSDARRHRRAC